MSELTCPTCGQHLDRPTRFCPECGARLPDPPPDGAHVAMPTTDTPDPLKTLVLPAPEAPPAEPSDTLKTLALPTPEVPVNADVPPPEGAPAEAAERQLASPPLPVGAPPPAGPPPPVEGAPAEAAERQLVSPPLPVGAPPAGPPPPVEGAPAEAAERQLVSPPLPVGAPPPVEGAPAEAAERQLVSPPLPVGAPPPYPPPGTVVAQGNRRLVWWLVGGLGCLALVFFGACGAIGLLTLLGQRVGEGAELRATTITRDDGDVTRGSTSASGELLLEDDFSDELTSALDISEDETSRSAYEDGVYVIEVKVPEMVVWSLAGGPYADVSIEVEAEVPAGSDVTAAGIIFHYQDNDNFYLYSVSNDGYYQLELLQDGEWIMLIDPTLSDAVDGGRNTLRIETRGARIALYVNGVLLEETADTTFTSGDAGLAVSTFEESSGTVAFDNLVVVRAE